MLFRSMTTYQAAQVAGFVADGAVVGAFGARAAVLADADTFDAGTFLASAGLLALGVRGRPAPAAGRLTLGRQAVRVPMLLGWLSAFYNLQKGIAVPLPAAGRLPRARSWPRPRWGRPTRWALASLAGSDTRQRLTVPLAFGAYSVLALAAVRPGLPGLLVILLVAGLCDSYQVQANAAFVAAVPDGLRAQAFGVAVGGMHLSRGGDDPGRGGNLAAGRAQLTMAAGIIPSRCSASQRPPFRSAPDPVPVWLL